MGQHAAKLEELTERCNLPLTDGVRNRFPAAYAFLFISKSHLMVTCTNIWGVS